MHLNLTDQAQYIIFAISFPSHNFLLRLTEFSKNYGSVLGGKDNKGLLTERAVLAAIGTHDESYIVAPDVRIKALELVEHGKLSERGLVAILGL